MKLKQVVLDIQRRLFDADINVDRMEHVNPEHLHKGIKRIDIYLDMFVPKKRPYVALDRVAKVLTQHYGKNDGGFWHLDAEKALIAVGVDIDNDAQAYISVEEQSEEFINNMVGEQRVGASFKQFVTEARKPGVSFTEEKTKGVVTKVIAELEAHEAGRLTKLAREYHKIVKLLDKLEKAKAERNAQLKELIGTTFDAEADKYFTRVLKSATFAATLARETHPDDIAEKVEIQYEKLVDGLMALLSDELKPAGDELLAACTRKWKPEPKSPNLIVKKIDESLGETVRAIWRGLKEKIAKHLAAFDKRLPKLEKDLEAYKAERDAHVLAGSHKASKLPPPIKPVHEGKVSLKQFINGVALQESDENPRSVNVDWHDIDDVEDLIEFAQDNLDEEQYEQLDSELQGLHIEDPDDHEEADDIIRDFLTKHYKP